MASALSSFSGFDKLRDLPDSGRRALGRLTDTVLEHLPMRRAAATTDVIRPQLPQLAPLASVTEREIAEAAVQQLLREIPESTVVAVIDAVTCLPLAVVGATEPEEASAYDDEAGEEALNLSPMGLAVQFDRIVKRVDAMSQVMGGGQEALTEVLVPTAHLLHIVRVVGDGRWHLYLAVPAEKVNMGLARTLLAQAADHLADATSVSH